MTLEELYKKLASDEFRDPSNNDLFYNFFIYQYPVEKDAEIRRQISEFKDALARPITYVDVLSIDLFEAFREYLGQRKFGSKFASLLEYLLNRDAIATDAEGHDSVTQSLKGHAEGDEFMDFVHKKILAHLDQAAEGNVIRPYVFLYGFAAIYPYLRASGFLDRYERLNDATRYKIILFYPGEFRTGDNHFSLFGKLHEDHPYRSHVLID